MYKRYGDQVEFLFVNVREAGHRIPGYEFLLDSLDPEDPDPLRTRRERVARAIAKRGLAIPAVIDTLDRKTERDYRAFPLRVFVVDRDGVVVHAIEPRMGADWLHNVEEWLKVHR